MIKTIAMVFATIMVMILLTRCQTTRNCVDDCLSNNDSADLCESLCDDTDNDI